MLCRKCGEWTPNDGTGQVGWPVTRDDFMDVTAVETNAEERLVTGFDVCDECCGGGFVRGTSTLVGGGPGLGKTTIMLQLAPIFSGLTGKASYYISAEQDKTAIKRAVDRMELPIKEGQLLVLRKFGSGGEIAEDVFTKTPPGMIILDSLTALCGLKNKNLQLEVCKTYKKYAEKYRALVFIICQMQKEGDYAGLLALQHEVDTLVSLDSVHDDRKRDRIFREHEGLVGDLRELIAWKNREGPTGNPFTLVMTAHGLTGLPKRLDDKNPDVPERTGIPLVDTVLERQALEEELRETQSELRERILDLRDQEAKLASQPQHGLSQKPDRMPASAAVNPCDSSTKAPKKKPAGAIKTKAPKRATTKGAKSTKRRKAA